MLKRCIDVLAGSIGLLVLSPVLILLAILIRIESKGNPIFKQIRVGKGNKDFYLFKFRSMHINAEAKGQLTIGKKDNRITNIGYFLRKYKLDELPQLWNVLIGEMSLVGPRPEVRKYVNLYTPKQLLVLSVKPGITDYASLLFFNENELLGKAENPEKTYIEEVMPQKLELNILYIQNQSLRVDLNIIFNTFLRIMRISHYLKSLN